MQASDRGKSYVGLMPAYPLPAKDMKTHKDRLLSFGHISSKFINPNPWQLAENGLCVVFKTCRLYLICAFCDYMCRVYRVDSKTLDHHRKQANPCPFLTGQDVGNIPFLPCVPGLPRAFSVDSIMPPFDPGNNL